MLSAITKTCLAAFLLAIPVLALASDDQEHKVTICHKGKPITIAMSAWPAHEAHGDAMGACPEPCATNADCEVGFFCYKGTGSVGDGTAPAYPATASDPSDDIVDCGATGVCDVQFDLAVGCGGFPADCFVCGCDGNWYESTALAWAAGTNVASHTDEWFADCD